MIVLSFLYFNKLGLYVATPFWPKVTPYTRSASSVMNAAEQLAHSIKQSAAGACSLIIFLCSHRPNFPKIHPFVYLPYIAGNNA